jgi:hypothetical protein
MNPDRGFGCDRQGESTPGPPHLKRALGVRDVAFFMVTAVCSAKCCTFAAFKNFPRRRSHNT